MFHELTPPRQENGEDQATRMPSRRDENIHAIAVKIRARFEKTIRRKQRVGGSDRDEDETYGVIDRDLSAMNTRY
jgi:hypothetical protein